MSVTNNVKKLMQEIGSAKLVCVTKYVEVKRINEAIKAGVEVIGESRIQEFEEKISDILPCEKHMIGHLQTNKAKKAVELFDVIQSVDTKKLILEIDRRAGFINKVQKILLQVNVGREPQKYGFEIEELKDILKIASELENIEVLGLMCIPPNVEFNKVRNFFRVMKFLFDEMKSYESSNICMKYLSMGMSGDYLFALGEGSNMVRVGSGIFGSRN